MPAHRRALASRLPGALRRIPRIGVALAAVMAAAAFSPVSASPSGAGQRTIAGDDIAVHNLVGHLTVRPGTGSAVVAEITTAGKDADRLRVEQGVLRGRPTLRVIYPSDRIRVDGMGPSSSTTLRVRDDGTLDVESGEGRKVTLSGRGSGLDARADIVLTVPRGKRVSIYWGEGKGDASDVDADLRIDGASFEVAARGSRGSLTIEVGSGSVSVERATGTVDVETGSGDVELRDVRGDGLKVETGSGRIDAHAIETARLELETGSGDVRAESVRAPRASLTTGSGAISMRLDGDADDLALESGSGDVTLVVPRAFGAAVHFETGSGDIDSNVPIEVRSRDRREIDGSIGDGRGRLNVETGSGSITIRRPEA
ncbi:MAG TPA: DUF4097 family beta strand repeat-containing protein [Candidatus Eisenbacteria bacterium]